MNPDRGSSKSKALAMAMILTPKKEEGWQGQDVWSPEASEAQGRAFSTLTSEGEVHFQCNGKLFEKFKQRSDLI